MTMPMRLRASLFTALTFTVLACVPEAGAQEIVRADTSGVVQAGSSAGMDRVRARLGQLRGVDRVRGRFNQGAAAPVIVVMPSAGPAVALPSEETAVRFDPLTGLYTRRRAPQPRTPPVAATSPVPDTVRTEVVRVDTVVVPAVVSPPGPPALPRVPIAEPPRTLVLSPQEVERALFETGVFRAVGINFAFGRSEILEGAEALIDPIGEVLAKYSEMYVEVGGHTDSIGGEAANQALSERRAESVAAYLRTRWDIAPERLRIVGYGEGTPLVSNATPTGRTLNRRVEFRAIPPPRSDRGGSVAAPTSRGL